MIVKSPPPDAVVYPDSDGKPMADNTLQHRWIVTIEGNLLAQFADDPDVFVAGDNLIYPKKGDPTVCTAPDVYVAFGRPKGDRGSYKVFDEGGVFPQVVFEVLSPSNTGREMALKRTFYRTYGVEEYYVIDPDLGDVEVAVRQKKKFVDVDDLTSFVSPRLGIRFVTAGGELVIVGPTGVPFLSFEAISRQALAEKRRADTEKRRADTQKRRADHADARADVLAAKLRAMGVDPETL